MRASDSRVWHCRPCRIDGLNATPLAGGKACRKRCIALHAPPGAHLVPGPEVKGVLGALRGRYIASTTQAQAVAGAGIGLVLRELRAGAQIPATAWAAAGSESACSGGSAHLSHINAVKMCVAFCANQLSRTRL